MPAAIVAVAGMAAGAAASAAAVTAGLVVAGGIGAAVISGVVGLAASSILSSAIGLNDQKSQAQSQSVDQLAKGVLLNTAGTVDPLLVVYGDRRVGGTRVLTESTGDSHEYLHIVIAHCEGPVASIGAVYLDGVDATDAKFAELVTVERFLGADDQAACQSLIDALPGKWTAAHKLSGVAYTYVRLKYDSNVFNSLPIVTADIHGRTVYDPRTGVTGWSNSPSLCTRDYLTNARYGRGVPAAEIDDVAFIVAANACETFFTAPDGTQHARHTCNGVVNTDQSSADNMVNLLACCRGMLVFSARGYGLLIDKAEVPIDFVFNEDNITGGWTFSPGGKRSRFNRVRGNWFNPARDWQSDIAVADSTAFRAEDNGLMLEAQVEMPFVTNPYEVQVLTERHLRQSRFGMTATFRAFIGGMFCEVGDVVPITHSTPGWASKPFRIMRISLLSSDEVEVEVAEYDDAVYSATPLTTPRLTPTTNLPDPTYVPAPTGLILAMSTQDQPNGSSVPRFTATWTAPLSMWVVGYDVAWREEDSPWDTAFVTEPRFTLLATAVGRLYEVRVRAVGSLGNKSVWVSTSGTQPAPTTPPAAPLAQAIGGLFCVRLSWSFGDTRQDIRATEIWFSSSNDRAAAMRLSSEPFPGTEYTHPGMSPGSGGYYWLRVIDVWGNISAWYPSLANNGLHGIASTDPSALLEQLQNALGMPQLAAELAEQIALIPELATDMAAVTTAAETAVDAASAAASLVDDVQARLDSGDFAIVKTSASASASALTSVLAKWSVKTQTMLDGQLAVAGIELLSGTLGQSTFAVLADKFLIYQPNGGGTPRQIMSVGTVNGVPALGFDGSGIFDGSVTARQINGTGLRITGNGWFEGQLNAATGTFTGAVNGGAFNVGSFTGYGWPAAGGTGIHIGVNGMLVGNPAGKYFQIYTPAGEWWNAQIYTNIPAFIGDLTVTTAKIADLNVNGNKITGVTTGSVYLGAGASVWIATPSTLGRVPLVGAPSATGSGPNFFTPAISIVATGGGFTITNNSTQTATYSGDYTTSYTSPAAATIGYSYL